MSLLPLLACAVIGFVAGVINAVAAGGSFLTLPLLLFLGLPTTVANATNRVGVIAQNVGATWSFHQHRLLDWKWSLEVSVPALVGAAIGVWAALIVPDTAFRRLLSVLMVAMSLAMLVHRSVGRRPAMPRAAGHWTLVLGFFGVGLYGGFVQAGVGFLVLGLTTLAGLDLKRGNAVKVLIVFLVTLLSLVAFAAGGHIDWRLGTALAAGNLAGGIVGVRIAVWRGHRWVEHVVLAAVMLFAVLLWFTG